MWASESLRQRCEQRSRVRDSCLVEVLYDYIARSLGEAYRTQATFLLEMIDDYIG
jgi:hypothetical protein